MAGSKKKLTGLKGKKTTKAEAEGVRGGVMKAGRGKLKIKYGARSQKLRLADKH